MNALRMYFFNYCNMLFISLLRQKAARMSNVEVPQRLRLRCNTAYPTLNGGSGPPCHRRSSWSMTTFTGWQTETEGCNSNQTQPVPAATHRSPKSSSSSLNSRLEGPQESSGPTFLGKLKSRRDGTTTICWWVPIYQSYLGPRLMHGRVHCGSLENMFSHFWNW